MRQIPDELQYRQILFLHSGADGISTCIRITRQWNSVIAEYSIVKRQYDEIYYRWSWIVTQSVDREPDTLCGLIRKRTGWSDWWLSSFSKTKNLCLQTISMTNSLDYHGCGWDHHLRLESGSLLTTCSGDLVLRANGFINKPRYQHPEWSTQGLKNIT